MSERRYIGENLREAINWTQDLLRTSRPIAENTVLSAINAGTIAWDDGVYLTEDDEEIEKRKIASVQTTQKNYNAAKKWSRIQFRNQKKASGKYSLNSVHKNAASKFSNTADGMVTGGDGRPAALPSASIVEEDDPSS